MAAGTLEERVRTLEARQDELQRLIEDRLAPESAAKKRGWRAIVGSFSEDPLYEEAMDLGRKWREAQRDEADGETD